MAAAICLTLGLVAGATAPRAAELVATNLDLLTRLTAGVVQELQGKMLAGVAGRPVALKPFAAGEEYTFVTNVFTAELTRAGVTTLQQGTGSTASAADSTGPVVLQYQNVAFGVSYVDSHRAYLVGGKRVERRAIVRIMATLSEPDGRVLWVGEAQRESEDEFEQGDAALVEQGTYQFARPVMPAGGWGRYAEPVFVTGIIVGLIYLFFSNQSDN